MNMRFARKSKQGLLILLILALITLITLGMFILHHHTKNQPAPTKTVQQSSAPWANHNLTWHRVTVSKGDSLTRIFSTFRISYHQVHTMLEQPVVRKYLGKLYLGQTFYLHVDTKKDLIILKYPINSEQTLIAYRNKNIVNAIVQKQPMTTALIFKSGIINKSLASAAKAAGLTYHMSSQLSNLFAGSINFSALRTGDHFSILYKEYYLNGKKVHPGPIIAASFTHEGKTYKAVRFTYPHGHTGYYTPDGKGVEPLFLKAPLKYKRISGHFTFHRYDPVLHVVHPHLGIDYAAKYGTPIKSIGDGKVIFHGKKGGYGNAVVVRYSRKYRALYGHMSRIATHLKNGEHIKKGQVIGYVGSTGWSTGPHLHFEMYVYNIPRNPLKMKFIGGKSIPKSYMQPFKEQAAIVLAELDRHEGTKLAFVANKWKTINY